MPAASLPARATTPTERSDGEAETRKRTGVTVIANAREPHALAAVERTDRLEHGERSPEMVGKTCINAGVPSKKSTGATSP